MKRILLIVSAFLMISLVSSGQVIVTGSNGANGTYASLTGVTGGSSAFATINANDQTGMDIIIGIVADVTVEEGTTALNQGNWKSLLIAPNGNRTVSGTVAGPLITLNGADRVTINGLNSGSNSLTISNLSTSNASGTSTIKFQADAINNTLTNLTVLGSATVPLATNGGTIYFGTATTTGNDTITISKCLIGAAGTNLPSKGIYANGTTTSAATANNYITIEDCEIYDFFLTGGCAGIYALTGNTEWTIKNNKIYQKSTRTFTTSGTMYGIYFANTTYGNNIQILNNIIGYGGPTGTGTLTLDGSTVAGAFQGIYMSISPTASAACRIKYNTISDISLTSSSGTYYGINHASSSPTSNTVNIDSNTVRNLASVTSTGLFYGIYTGGATNQTTSYNTLTNLTRSGSGILYPIALGTSDNNTINGNNISYIQNSNTSSTSALYGIYSVGSPKNNTYTNNVIMKLTHLGTGTASVTGIRDASGTGFKVFQNNIIDSLSTGGGGTLIGIYTGTASATNPMDISGNTVRNFSSFLNAYGIQYANSSTAGNIYRNKIWGFTTANAGATVHGIYISSSVASGIVTVYNNLIGDLNATAASGLNAVNGINISASTATTFNVYYNTINLSAVSSSPTFGSSCVYFPSTATALNLKNNILTNLSTPGSDGLNVATNGISACLRRSAGTAGTVPSNYSTTSDYNDFYCNPSGGTNNHLSYVEGTSAPTNPCNTVANLKTFMVTRDMASIEESPNFLSTAGTSSNFLHINAGINSGLESGGNNVTGITVDYDGATRQGNPGYPGTGSAPDIGADEFEGLPAYTCTPPAPGNTLSSANDLCNGQSITLSMQNATAGTGVTYQWKSSTDGTTFTEISGATASTYTYVPTAELYYKCTVTCQKSPVTSATSNPLQVTFLSEVTSTTPGSRCGLGTVQLGASGTAGTVGWYTSALGGSKVGSGSPFTTPEISATTTYYAGIENYSGGSAAVGAGATTSATYSNPFYSAWSNIHTQHLITAAELSAAGIGTGDLTSVALDVTSAGTLPMIDLSVKIAATTATTMSAFVSPAFTTVFTSASYMPTTGLNVLTFTSPFYWDGISNIVLEFCHGNGSSTSTMSRTVKADNTSYVSTIKTHVSSATAASVICANTTSNLLTYSVRPQFTFAGQVVCSSPRVGVVATVNAPPALTLTGEQTLCNAAIGTLQVTSNLADYTSYLWSPVTNLYTDAACTVPYTTGTSATTLYITATDAFSTTYTCTASNSGTGCVNVATSLVYMVPGSPVVTPTSSSLCLSGSTLISLSPATGWGKCTFQWQNSSDGITFGSINGATSTTYTTPTITSTTYYRLLIRNDAGTICTTPQTTVTVYNPTLISATGATRCGTGTVTLTASATGGTVNWYTSPTGGLPVGTGTPFVTPVINSTTSFYASVSSGGNSGLTIPGDGGWNHVTTSGSFQTSTITSAYMLLNVLQPLTLTSMDIYPSASMGSSFTIVARTGSSSGTTVATYTGTTTVVNSVTPTVAQTVPVEWQLPIGTYYIGFTTNPNTWRSGTATHTFPWTLAGYASMDFYLTPSYQYYFYNLTLATGCETGRTEVIAEVTIPPYLAINGSQTVCNNSPATLSVTSSLENYDTYVWSPADNLFTDAGCTVPYTPLSSASTVYAKTSTAGAVQYLCNGHKVDGDCSDTALTLVTVLPASATITGTPTAVCVSGTSVLKLSPETGWGAATFQWQISPDGITYTDIDGATSQNYTTDTIDTQTYYKLLIKNSAGGVCLSPEFTLQIDNPHLVTTTPGERCGVGTVDLAATGTGGVVNWYSSELGGEPLATGNTFTTPVINHTTTYYVGVSGIGAYNDYVGMVPTQFGTSGSGKTTYGLYFNALTNFTLHSVVVYPNSSVEGTPGTITASVIDSTGLVLHTATVNVTGHPQSTGLVPETIYLDFYIQSASKLRLVLGNFTGISGVMFQPSAQSPYAFPFTLPGIVSITSGTYSAAVHEELYYYFYHWNVVMGCSSARQAIQAVVTPPPAVTATVSDAEICLGGSVDLNATSPETNYTYVWNPGGLTGAAQTIAPATTTTYIVTASETINDCSNTDTVVVTVRPLPNSITVTPPTGEVGTITQMSVPAAGSGFSDGFETFPSPNFAATGAGITPAASTTYYSEGVQSVRISYVSTAAAYTTSTDNSYQYQGSINLAGANAAQLTFSHICALEGYTYSYDAGYVEYSTDGGTTWTVFPSTSYAGTGTLITTIGSGTGTPVSGVIFSTKSYPEWIAQFTGSTATPGTGPATALWKTETINVPESALSSTQFKIRFQITHDASVTYYGWLIDNVALTVSQPAITWSPTAGLYTDAGATIPYTGEAASTVYGNPAGPVTYTATATNGYGCTTTGTCIFTSNNTTLNLVAFVEGLYNGAGGLNQASESDGENAWPIFTSPAYADTVTIVLAEDVEPDYSFIHYYHGVGLNTDGSISLQVPSSVSGDFYVVLKHRNSVETWNATPVTFPSGTPISLNWTLDSNATYGWDGGNEKPGNGIAGPPYLIYSGEVCQTDGSTPPDGYIDGGDVGNIFNLAQIYDYGYKAEDLTGDGFIDGFDVAIVFNNAQVYAGKESPQPGKHPIRIKPNKN